MKTVHQVSGLPTKKTAKGAGVSQSEKGKQDPTTRSKSLLQMKKRRRLVLVLVEKSCQTPLFRKAGRVFRSESGDQRLDPGQAKVLRIPHVNDRLAVLAPVAGAIEAEKHSAVGFLALPVEIAGVEIAGGAGDGGARRLDHASVDFIVWRYVTLYARGPFSAGVCGAERAE